MPPSRTGAVMNKDLRVEPPRRWSESLGGICWLPRLIDKVRAAVGGTLGDYLYGQSPMDTGLLRELGLRYREFTEIVRGASDDGAVLAALEARVPDGVERAREWSRREIPGRHRLFLWFIDVDDGYIGSGSLKRPINAGTHAFIWLVRRVFPSARIS